jgi:2-polyprenyl-3-methyl-5-hydroxy-6-metoxy-1,4-benzoquinol methylase
MRKKIGANILFIMGKYYIEAKKIKEKPELYEGIEESCSWILKENYLFDFLEKLGKGNKILDIGCGNGIFLDRLKKQGFGNIAGADLANYLKDKSHKHIIADINVEKLPIEESSYDVITALQVLEHLENYFLILQEAARVLKPGGYFIFSVPHPFNIFYRIKFALTGNMSGFTPDNNHYLFLTRDVFKKTFLKDFEVADIHYSRGPVPMLGRLNIIPGVKLKAKYRILPRCSWFADRVCYILRKK